MTQAHIDEAEPCRQVEVDGETVLIRGAGDFTERDIELFGEIVRAAKRKHAAEHRSTAAAETRAARQANIRSLLDRIGRGESLGASEAELLHNQVEAEMRLGIHAEKRCEELRTESRRRGKATLQYAERVRQVEAEVQRWLAFIERGMDTHMQFSVIREDGSTEQLPCADWCYACRIEKAEGAVARVGELHRKANNGDTCVYCAHGQRVGYDTTWPCDTIRALDEPAPGSAATDVTELETTARVFAALRQSAEQDVSRVIALYEQWVKAGPPPIGAPLARWWDARLVELHAAILPPEQPSATNPTKEHDMEQQEHATPVDWQAVAAQRERELKTVGEQKHAAEEERDGAYRERAHLVALLAAMTEGAVIASAYDVDEPGWQIVYLYVGGRQASWHISPRDADLFAHVEHVDRPLRDREEPMTIEIWSNSDREWKPVPGVTDFILSFSAVTEAVTTVTENTARALEKFSEALRRDIEPASVPVVAFPCRSPHAVTWPQQFGKTAFTIDIPFSGALRQCFEPLFAAARARKDRRLARLAGQLGRNLGAMRHQFDTVVRVLEAAGIADGYGNLTIPQPVRPPVQPPVASELVPVYAAPFEQLARPSGSRPAATWCSWKSRPQHNHS
ncbi:hypothetical protein [Streptomyces sp. NPDC050263]|uniref:hypothetical protein n=1 Tax=Streptomyces sp. NPDC050263 TaxID=3155037 RepID=UPI0034309300